MKIQDKNSIIKVLKTGDASERKEVIEELMFNPIDEDILQTLCSMLSDSDKGVRSTLSIALSSNNSWNSSKYLVDFISSEDITLRNLAGEILLNLGKNAVIDLVKKLDGANAADEKFVIDLLGLIRDNRSNKIIMQVLHKSEDENVILACVEALGNLKAIESTDILIEYYDKNEIFRPIIVEALGRIGGNKSREFMMKVFDSCDVLTKYSIVDALETIGDEKICYFLLGKLDDFDGPLSWSLIKTISTIQQSNPVLILVDDKLKKIILDTINEADIEYKIAAVKLVLKLEGFHMLKPFLEIYGQSQEIDNEVKGTLIKQYKKVIDLLPAVFNESHGNIKAQLFLLVEILQTYSNEICETIEDMKLRNLADSLTKLLAHSDEEVRRLTFEILFAFATDTALMFIDDMLEDENIWNRLRLGELLASLNDERAFEALAKLEDDENEMVSENARNLKLEKNNNTIG